MSDLIILPNYCRLISDITYMLSFKSHNQVDN
jgi:hypothetical protein